MALLLAWCKQIVPSDVAFKEDRWLRPPHTYHLQGKTAGIIGLGNIGVEIAKRLRAFDMRIVAMKRQVADLKAKSYGVDLLYSSQGLRMLLGESDFVFVACPLTSETEGLLGPEEFALMKPNSVLVNIARAEIVREEALYEALKTGQIAGACLDVWYRKPSSGAMFQGRLAPSRYPINRLENVVAAPHLGYKTEDAFDRVWSIVADNIERVATGRPVTNLVNKKAGY